MVSGRVLLGLPAIALRAAAGVCIVVAVLLLVLGLVTPSTRQEQAAESSSAAPVSGRLDAEFLTREHVITGAYKVYGRPDGLWLAKAHFRNNTNGAIKDLRVRYRLGEWADWSSWQTHPTVVPTQTVVDLYRPIISGRCMSLTSNTPCHIQLEYEYTDAAGARHGGQTSKPIVLLGRGDFIFTDLSARERTGSFHDFITNAPLLAAYVTSKDGPVEGLASMANKAAGGAGAGADNESCLAVMRELYEIMRTIRITYQHPGTNIEQGRSFDPKLVQTLQYPRDTIRKRSGTCIDLAILYAAMMQSVGIRPQLVILPGHVFPMAVLPGGDIMPVESTMVGGGGARSGDFEAAVNSGFEQWKELRQSGQFYVIDCRTWWSAGIDPPELEPLAADILDSWKVTEQFEQAQRGGGGGGRNNPQPPPPPPPPPATLQSGNYAVVLTAGENRTPGQAQVQVQGQNVTLSYLFDYQVAGPDGRPHAAREIGQFAGTLQGRTLTARSGQVRWLLDGQDVPPQGLPYTMNLTAAADGRSAAGTVTMSNGTQIAWQMQLR